MLGSKASYAEDLNATAPFCRGSVSWPDSAGGVALSGAVPEGERSRVADALARLSLAPEELEAIRASERGSLALTGTHSCDMTTTPTSSS